MAPIAVGNVIPDGTLSYFDEQDQLQNVSIHSLAKGKNGILFAVPGSFTPTGSMHHVPGFLEKAEELISKGVLRFSSSLCCFEEHVVPDSVIDGKRARLPCVPARRYTKNVQHDTIHWPI